MPAEKPKKGRSEELLFCLQNTRSSAKCQHALLEGSKLKLGARSGMWNPPSGRGQVPLLVAPLSVSLHVLLTSGHLTQRCCCQVHGPKGHAPDAPHV